MKHLVLASTLCLWGGAACALNICTNEQGQPTFQEAPCAQLPTNAAHQPPRANELTPKLAKDTVQKYAVVLSKRDPTAASGYLARNFTATVKTARGVNGYDRSDYARMLTRRLSTATSYTSVADCAEPREDSGNFVVVCETMEKRAHLSKEQTGSATETFVVTLEEGSVKFASVTSVEH